MFNNHTTLGHLSGLSPRPRPGNGGSPAPGGGSTGGDDESGLDDPGGWLTPWKPSDEVALVVTTKVGTAKSVTRSEHFEDVDSGDSRRFHSLVLAEDVAGPVGVSAQLIENDQSSTPALLKECASHLGSRVRHAPVMQRDPDRQHSGRMGSRNDVVLRVLDARS